MFSKGASLSKGVFITTKVQEQTSLPESVSGAVVFVTDIHLRSSQDPHYKALLELIERVDENSVEYFVLLGDIFDFYFGYARFFYRKFSELFEALEALSEKGVRVLFVQGNHEFSLEKSPWKGVELILSGTHKLCLKNGTKVVLCHGDYLLGKKDYVLYMKIVRSRIFQNLTRLVPPALTDKICLKLAEKSRKKNKPLDKKRLKEKAYKWLSSFDAELGFLGHFHISLEHEFESVRGKQKVIFVNAWHRPHVTVLGSDNKIHKITFSSSQSRI